MSFTIRDAIAADVPALLDIHNWSIDNLDGIWIEKRDNLSDRQAWFADRQKHNFPVLIAEDDKGNMLGYASYGTYRGRDGYDLTVEHSVYLYPAAQGKGLGRTLLEMLIKIARERGMHIMVAVIDGDNQVSIRLHEKLGFVDVGTIPQAGKKRGVWRDQAMLYLTLDNRAQP